MYIYLLQAELCALEIHIKALTHNVTLGNRLLKG